MDLALEVWRLHCERRAHQAEEARQSGGVAVPLDLGRAERLELEG